MTRISMLALLSLGLAACAAGPPTQFYTLDPVAPSGSQPADAAMTPLVVAVSIPETLDRPQLVRRAGPDHLDISGLDRWAAPLDDLTRRALARDLALRMPGRSVLPERPLGAAEPAILAVDIDGFAADATGQVVLDGRWSTTGASAGRPSGGSIHIVVAAADTSASAVVQAMSAALGVLADQIATASR